MTRHPIRDTLHGGGFDQDRLWLLHLPDGRTFGILDYNDEMTGYSPELQIIDPKIFHFGGNAYYVVTHYAKEHGWRVEEIEDRR